MSNLLITAASAQLHLSIASLYPTPQLIQGFATDDAFNFGEVEVTETMLGVDGNLSVGWVPVIFTQTIVLQADSDSNTIFETWHTQQQLQRTPFQASGTVVIPATQRSYNLTRGFLRQYTPVPPVRKVLQQRSYSIVWNNVTPAAYAGGVASIAGTVASTVSGVANAVSGISNTLGSLGNTIGGIL